MKRRAVIYTRVSTEEQVKGYSLTTQRESCNQKANEAGFDVVKEFEDEGISAKTIEARPGLVELIKYVTTRKNNISAVYFWDVSRLSRDTNNYLTIKNKFAEHGIQLLSVTENLNFEPDDPDGEFIETIFAARAQWDNKKKAKTVKTNMYKKFQLGDPIAKVPLGYLKQEGKVVRDPDLFEPIQRLWYRIERERMTLSEVIKTLNDWGIKPSKRAKKWYRQTASKVFANKFYAGILYSPTYQEEVPGNWEPMIDLDTFHRVRTIFDKRVNRKDKTKYAKLRDDLPIRGILNCPKCPRKLTGVPSTNKVGDKYGYYFCHKNSHHPNERIQFNSHDTKKEKGLDTLFVEYLQKVSYNEKWIAWFLELVEEQYNARYGAIKESQKALKKQVKQLKQSLTDAGVSHAKKLYSDEQYIQIKNELEAEIMVKNTLIAEKTLDTIDLKTILNWNKFYLSNLDRAWLDADIHGKMKIACSIFPEGLTWNGNEFSNTKIGAMYRLKETLTNASVSDGEPIVPQLEHLFKSILHTYSRLKELGFTYFDGTVSIIETEGDSHD